MIETIIRENPISYKRTFVINGEFIVSLLFGFFLFLSFFEVYLQGIFGVFTRYYLFIFLVVIVICIPRLRLRWYHLVYLAWFAYKIISALWTPNLYIARLHLVSHVGMTLLLILTTSVNFKKRTSDLFVQILWLSSFLTGILFVFLKRPYLGVHINRQVIYLFGMEMDPNNLAAFLVIGIIISIYYIIKRRLRLLSILVIIVNTYSTFLTGSRGGLVALVLSTIILILITAKSKVIRPVNIILLMALLVIAFIYLRRFIPESIYNRLLNFDSYEGGSGRVDIWINALSLFGENSLFWGAGWGAYFGHQGIEMAVHNTFISMLVDVGIFGFVLFFGPIVVASFILFKRRNVLPVVLLFNSFVLSLFLDTINKRFFWIPIIMLFIDYNFLSSSNELEELTHKGELVYE